jgi:hypothetical protein
VTGTWHSAIPPTVPLYRRAAPAVVARGLLILHLIHDQHRIPVIGVRELDIDTRVGNALLWSIRCLDERGLRAAGPALAGAPACHRQPGEIGLIAGVALVLVLFEHKMIT